MNASSLTYVVAGPLVPNGDSASLFCLSCQEHGHACVHEFNLHSVRVRIFLRARGGSLFARVVKDPQPYDTSWERVCGSCGCSQKAACPEGCEWSTARRWLTITGYPTVSFPICSRCDVRDQQRQHRHKISERLAILYLQAQLVQDEIEQLEGDLGESQEQPDGL
jgi:hypothetical protein